MNIIILGMPGSGKGTISKFISETYNFRHFSSGELIREHQRQGTKIGLLANEVSDKGMYLPDDIIMRMVKEEVLKNGDDQLIFDGFPRTIEQAKQLHALMLQRGKPITSVIYLENSIEECIKRLLIRSTLEGRVDDTPIIIERRIDEYNTKTKKLVKFFEDKGILNRVDASGTVAQEIERIASLMSEKIIAA